MERLRPLPTALLLALLTVAAGICASTALAASRPGCWRAERRGEFCPAPGRRDWSWRGSRRSGEWRKRRGAYRGNEVAIRQLSPRLRPRYPSRLRFETQRRCDPSGDGGDACSERDLAEALIRTPNRYTRPILRQNGIPAFRDVPPIVILRSHRRGRD
jgi:hypothetical protein